MLLFKRRQFEVVRVIFFLLLLLSLSVAQNFDLLVVKRLQYLDNEPEYCRIYKTESDIEQVHSILESSISENLLCGFHYEFRFYQNSKLAQVRRVNKDCEDSSTVVLLESYFPNINDPFRYYSKSISSIKQLDSLVEGVHTDSLFLLDEKAIFRFPQISVKIRFDFRCSDERDVCKEEYILQDSIWKFNLEECLKDLKTTVEKIELKYEESAGDLSEFYRTKTFVLFVERDSLEGVQRKITKYRDFLVSNTLVSPTVFEISLIAK